jgi:hypothetical protein
VCGPLLVFSFIDISVHILFQIPFYKGTEAGYYQRLFGFERIVYTNPNVTTFGDLVGGVNPTTGDLYAS